MPPLERYVDKGPVDCTTKFDTTNLKGKSVVVTGGAKGLGEAYVRAFAKAGAFVTIADLDESAGQKLASEFPKNSVFVKCDVTSWDDQLAVFKTAVAKSPANSVDIVLANAGISGPDPVYSFDEDLDEPVKPSLKILEVNVLAVFYTIKLSFHYFKKHADTPDRDRCLILQGSIAGFLDQPGSPQYCASKFGLRGTMRSLRTTLWQEGIRVNYIGPWFIRTTILSPDVQKYLEGRGVYWARSEDCASAALRIAANQTINGRALGIVPREEAASGYMDLVHDDYAPGDFFHEWQKTVLAVSHRLAVSAKDQ